MKFLFFITILISTMSSAQDYFPDSLYHSYDRYKDNNITRKRFTHKEMLPSIEKLKHYEMFNVTKIGNSFEGREINMVSTGHGHIKVLLWSQMHGDESTATMALLDIFNFLSANDEFNYARRSILSNLSLYFIPMLNPDGAEKFQRRTAQEIDMNRDALELQTPEANILKNMRDSLNADFGFNLHDQSTRYSAGNSFKSAAISFLAPAYNFEKEINTVREKSIKLIAYMNDVLTKFIPGHIAKYSDEFEPRAFGDNVQKWGTSTILIESGGWKNDLEKQFLRKINFIAILSALRSIAEHTYLRYNLDHYLAIPDNGKYIFDLILRNVLIRQNEKEFKIDLGINRYEEIENGITYTKGILEDAGDLSIFYGYDDIDCNGMEYDAGKTLDGKSLDSAQISNINFENLYTEGYTSIFINTDTSQNNYTSLPILIKKKLHESSSSIISLMKPANFLIREKGKIRFAIINGFICDLLTATNKISNGIIEP